MKNIQCLFVALLTMLGGRLIDAAGQHPLMPPGMSHENHFAQMQRDAEMKKRGGAAMGFDQDAVVHHFALTPAGGAIQVEVRNQSDETNRQAIRTHLRQIATAFSSGDFEAPFMTHGEVPSGVATLQRLKNTLTYTFNETPNGGLIRIATTNAESVSAIHEFLRYQIREHHTGDPLIVVK
jgi:hypothetical protein